MRHLSTVLVVLAANISGLAMAQTASPSNVTLYGRLDTSIESVRFSAAGTTPSKSVVNMSKGTSWWGMRGREDLGGGMNAYFKLESGFYMDGGDSAIPNKLFNREAYVGIGGRFGNVQLGSQYSPALLLTMRVDPFQRVSNGAILNLMQQSSGNRNRGYLGVQNNAIHYISPSIQGATVHAMYGLSERADEPKDVDSFKSVGLEYDRGPFYGGLTLEDQKVASVPAGSSMSNKTYTLGATYDLGFMKLNGYLLKNSLDNNKDVNAYMLGLVYPIGTGQIRGAYSSRKIEDTAGSKANVFSLGYTYDLSKRTTLFTTYSRLNNGFASNLGLLPSNRTYGLPVNDQDISSFEIGVRHNF